MKRIYKCPQCGTTKRLFALTKLIFYCLRCERFCTFQLAESRARLYAAAKRERERLCK